LLKFKEVFMRLLSCRVVAGVLLAAALSLPVAGKFANPTEPMPAERMVKNAEAWIKEKPTDAQGYYVLGRVHAMAWAYGAEITLIKPADDKSLPGFAGFQEVQVRHPEKAATEADVEHLAQALKAYERAVQLDPKNALYALGYASTLQEAGARAAVQMADYSMRGKEFAFAPGKAEALKKAAKDLGDSDPKVRDAGSKALRDDMPLSLMEFRGCLTSDDPEVKARAEQVVKGYWELKALEVYRKAYEAALPGDLTGRGRGPGANTQVSGEAGQAILAILKTQPQAAKADEVKEITANLAKLGTMGRAMTPVIFAMPGGAAERVGDLVDSSKRVGFDLAGDGVSRTWPWVKDGTALLVWDPRGTGAITSGRQLFGSRTWWISFRDGYEALALLDDNRDGRLTGGELQGIGVWIDRNGDGISQQGEVLTLEAAGITEIGVRGAVDADGVLMNPAGITFSDGRSVKTFDWLTEPVETEGSGGK
jgi:hypothetical protein